MFDFLGKVAASLIGIHLLRQLIAGLVEAVAEQSFSQEVHQALSDVRQARYGTARTKAAEKMALSDLLEAMQNDGLYVVEESNDQEEGF